MRKRRKNAAQVLGTTGRLKPGSHVQLFLTDGVGGRLCIQEPVSPTALSPAQLPEPPSRRAAREVRC